MFSTRNTCNHSLIECQFIDALESSKENFNSITCQNRSMIDDDDGSLHSSCMIIDEDQISDSSIKSDEQSSINLLSMGLLPEHVLKSTKMFIAYENRMMEVCLVETVLHLEEQRRLTVSHQGTLYSIPKRHLYFSNSCHHRHYCIAHQTRVLHKSSLRQPFALGFIGELPSIENHFRHLILFDDGTAAYVTGEDSLHLCLSQDFHENVRSIELSSARSSIEAKFNDEVIEKNIYQVNEYLRVKKFGEKYHNVQIIEIDCSLLKLKFYQRQAQTEIWMHYQSILIESNSFTGNRASFNGFNKVGRIYTSPFISASLSDHYQVHQCSSLCVSTIEKDFNHRSLSQNPYTLPLRYGWQYFWIQRQANGSFIKKPYTRKVHKTNYNYLYRSPCGRSLLTLDELEDYLLVTNSKLSIKFFINNRSTCLYSTFLYNPKHILINDISEGKEIVPISVYNDRHDQSPESFVYGTKVRSHSNLSIEDSGKITCCSCTDDCRDRMKCPCWLKTFEQAKLNNDVQIQHWQRQNLSDQQMIVRFGYTHQRLKEMIWSGIYECNSNCSCHQQRCTNRLVQNGLHQQLQLFYTDHKGWGIRVLHDIPQGSFIMAYVGELITEKIAIERDFTYLAILDHKSHVLKNDQKNSTRFISNQTKDKSNDSSSMDEEDDSSFILDAKAYGSISRFCNHSCKPNVYIQHVFIETHDPRFPVLALFANRSIRAGEEISWDYNYTVGCMPDVVIHCQCRTSHCRGRLL